MKYSLAALGLSAALVAAGPVLAQQTYQHQTRPQPTHPQQAAVQVGVSPQAFLKGAIQGDLAEMQLGRLAQQKAGNNKQLQQFGEMLQNDHAANKRKAQAVAKEMGVAVPGSPNAEQQHTYQQLSQLEGPEFERQFASHMVADHQRDVAKFTIESKSSNPQIAQFAQGTLPVLKKHLQHAEALEKSTGSSKP